MLCKRGRHSLSVVSWHHTLTLFSRLIRLRLIKINILLDLDARNVHLVKFSLNHSPNLVINVISSSYFSRKTIWRDAQLVECIITLHRPIRCTTHYIMSPNAHSVRKEIQVRSCLYGNIRNVTKSVIFSIGILAICIHHNIFLYLKLHICIVYILSYCCVMLFVVSHYNSCS